MKKKLNKFEQLIANLDKAAQNLKTASAHAVATLEAHAEKIEAINQKYASEPLPEPPAVITLTVEQMK